MPNFWTAIKDATGNAIGFFDPVGKAVYDISGNLLGHAPNIGAAESFLAHQAGNAAGSAVNAAGKAAGQAIFGNINGNNLLLRVGEVILGVVLLAIALNVILKPADKIEKVSGIAATAAKVIK